MKKVQTIAAVMVASGILLTSAAWAADSASASAPTAPATPPSPPPRGPALTLAVEAAQKALSTCQTIDQNVAVTVLNVDGSIRVVLASDKAAARGIQSSQTKASTALSFGDATSHLAERAKTDTDLAQKLAASPNNNIRAGGILIKVGNEVIGALGVGGAHGSEKDEACAQAGLNLVQDRLK